MRFLRPAGTIHREPTATYEASGDNLVRSVPEIPYLSADPHMHNRTDGSRLTFKFDRLCTPKCEVTTTWRIDSIFLRTPHLAAHRSNLSEPSSNPLFLSPRYLDMFVNSDSWVTNPNATNQDTCDRQDFK